MASIPILRTSVPSRSASSPFLRLPHGGTALFSLLRTDLEIPTLLASSRTIAVFQGGTFHSSLRLLLAGLIGGILAATLAVTPLVGGSPTVHQG